MASTITDTAINEASGLTLEEKHMLMKVNDGSATSTDVGACLLDHSEKGVLNSLIGATATRQSINASKTSLPFKNIALQIANV